ncbi:MAG TPA: cytochrome c oxidase subunit II, partial [Actinomycetota bacterium]|nr:cytochrome c oxidase subunit II [Actinomycetota bacterium]
VFLVVAGMLVAAVVRAKRDPDRSLDRREIGWGEPFIAVAGVFLPFVILAGVYVFSLQEMNELANRGKGAATNIEVIAHNWWWEVRYENSAVSANEIHIPTGRPIRLELTSADVIHSFWVPELQVKTDHIPGRTNHMWLQADEPGRYRGQCAEYCGLQHANMIFYVIAHEPQEFERWLAHEVEPAGLPEEAEAQAGAAIFMESSCAGCHAVRGTQAAANLGPDLTHFSTRTTIAGVLPNARSNLHLFVRDPHGIKPGVAMPPTELDADELDAVLDYLEALD